MAHDGKLLKSVTVEDHTYVAGTDDDAFAALLEGENAPDGHRLDRWRELGIIEGYGTKDQKVTAASGGTESEGDHTVAELPAALASMNDLDAVRGMKRKDKRSSAKPLYDKRIAELKGE